MGRGGPERGALLALLVGAGLMLLSASTHGAAPVKLVRAEPAEPITGAQANNDGEANNSAEPSNGGRCLGKFRAVGAGVTWSFVDPVDPAVTPAFIKTLLLSGRNFAIEGWSDTDASQAIFRPEGACLRGPARRLVRRRTTPRTWDSDQIENNGAAISSGPIRARCRAGERAIGWSTIGPTVIDPVSTFIYAQVDSVRVHRREVVGIVDSDTNADSVKVRFRAVCLREPAKHGLAVRVRKATGVIAPSAQSNNAVGVLQSPLVTAKCKRGERAVSGSAFWRFESPTDPSVTLAQLQTIDIRRRSVRVQGGSDTDADRSTLVAQAVCLKRL